MKKKNKQDIPQKKSYELAFEQELKKVLIAKRDNNQEQLKDHTEQLLYIKSFEKTKPDFNYYKSIDIFIVIRKKTTIERLLAI